MHGVLFFWGGDIYFFWFWVVFIMCRLFFPFYSIIIARDSGSFALSKSWLDLENST